MMYYRTIKEFESMLDKLGIIIISVTYENKWINLLLSTGIRIKFRNW